MTAAWNPWGLPEVDAETAKRRIEVVRSYQDFDIRIEDRSGRPFLAVYETERGICYGGELIAKGDVDAVREMLPA